METKSKTSQLKTGATETSGHAYFFRSKSLIVATVSVTTALAITYVCYLKINDQAPKNQLSKFSNSGATAFVKPPLTKKNIPFEKFTINAEEQCKVINTNHTQISIPANAFIHADGTAVTGTVEVRYREMNDAVDFFLCGIPMTYDSGGTQYTFQSAGMCEKIGRAHV